nr:rhodanese-like domain-containing protein [uncultured Desulfobulbus sp.]
MKKALAIGSLALSLCTSVAFADNRCAMYGLGEDFCITNNAAYKMIRSDYKIGGTESANVFILDVRTPEEWKWVGYPGNNLKSQAPALEGRVIKIDWNAGVDNFLTQVDTQFEDIADPVIITMCRSGHRSYLAAQELLSHGYNKVYSMNDGFEGDKDSRGYRNLNGWKNLGFSYTY